MKKGCFLKFIIIFTIALAAIIYILQNKFDELFLEPGKELVHSVIENNWNKQLDYVKDSFEKDSLKSLLSFYATGIKSNKNLSDDKLEGVRNYLKQTLKDSSVNIKELSHINKLIKYALKNEE